MHHHIWHYQASQLSELVTTNLGECYRTSRNAKHLPSQRHCANAGPQISGLQSGFLCIYKLLPALDARKPGAAEVLDVLAEPEMQLGHHETPKPDTSQEEI
jgi:hypothetical protein